MSPMPRIALVQTIALSAALAFTGALGLPAKAQDDTAEPGWTTVACPVRRSWP